MFSLIWIFVERRDSDYHKTHPLSAKDSINVAARKLYPMYSCTTISITPIGLAWSDVSHKHLVSERLIYCDSIRQRERYKFRHLIVCESFKDSSHCPHAYNHTRLAVKTKYPHYCSSYGRHILKDIVTSFLLPSIIRRSSNII